jgi:hypothetical protein
MRSRPQTAGASITQLILGAPSCRTLPQAQHRYGNNWKGG